VESAVTWLGRLQQPAQWEAPVNSFAATARMAHSYPSRTRRPDHCNYRKTTNKHLFGRPWGQPTTARLNSFISGPRIPIDSPQSNSRQPKCCTRCSVRSGDQALPPCYPARSAVVGLAELAGQSYMQQFRKTVEMDSLEGPRRNLAQIWSIFRQTQASLARTKPKVSFLGTVS